MALGGSLPQINLGVQGETQGGVHSGTQRVNPKFRVGSNFRIIPEQYFSGMENVAEFLENIDNNLTYYEIPTQLACSYFKGHLTGRALDWFEILGYRVVEDKPTDYAHLKQALIKQFPVVRNRSELETLFFASSQKHNQKPSDFVRLEPQVLDYVEVRHPQTTANLLQIIDKYEEMFLNRKIRGSSWEFRDTNPSVNNRFPNRNQQKNSRVTRGVADNQRFDGRRRGGQSDHRFHNQGGRQGGSRNSAFRDSPQAHRFAIDCRKLNAITKYAHYPLPVIDDLITNIPHTGIMSTLDLKSVFFQLTISPNDIEKTAFITRNGTFAFPRMPFGLSGAAPNFQKAIDIILKPVIGHFVMVYMDDVIITSPSFNEHIEHLNQVFTLLRDAKLTLNEEKCHFASDKLKYLGLIISKEGIETDNSKVKAITEMKPSKNKAPVLQLPNFTEQFNLFTDASGVGIGAVLNRNHRPIEFASRTLSKAERNYNVTEHECLAVIWALSKFKTYFGSLLVKVITDHAALTKLTNGKNLSSWMIRCPFKLSEFNIEWEHRSDVQNVVVDVLSRNPVGNMDGSQISCAALRALALNSREQLIREQREDPEIGHI
ncbi:retrovirus-related Pol polyprotein from transposon 17.6 [Trichonephila clavipes]|nr:retrovirus-related Pol polyprotein from transposon 17.6 [Trichonephila clavipes]